MKILSNKKIYCIILVFSVIFLPYSAFASSIYIDTAHSEFFEDDNILFYIRVDSEGKNINTIEGDILLDNEVGAVSLIDINTAGSAFSLWPGKPLPSERNTYISFVGGAPNGLNSKDAIIFNIVLKLQKAGQITLTPNDINVYLNDGKGAKDKVSVKDLIINVLPKKSDSQIRDDWNNLISNDKTPPKFVEAIISRDSYVFDNQYFASFFAVDENSGIAYYEIKEGNRDFVRAESPYILQDQSLKSIIQIKAVDKAKNESIATPELAPAPIKGIPYKTYFVWILIAFVILAVIFWLWRYLLNKKSR
jgi:hypothetical protein